MLLSALPLPVRLAGGVVCVILLLSLGSKAPFLVLVAALLSWSLVGLSLASASGVYPGAAHLPVVGGLVQKLGPPPPKAQAKPDVQADGRDRATMTQDAQQTMKAMVGRHPAIDSILSSIVPLARNRAAKKQTILGAERAWVAIIHGPAGVGKSMLAGALADLLIGLEAAAKPVRVSLPPPAPGRFETNWDETLEQGVDGVILVDNARWLAETNTLTQGHQGEDFIRSINAFAERYPRRLCIVVTLTTEQRDVAFASQTAKEIMRRLTIVELVCGELDDSALMKIFMVALARHELTIDAEADKRVLRLIRRQRDFAGKSFDHAEAVRRIAESLSMRLAEQGRDRVTERDVTAVSDMMDQNS